MRSLVLALLLPVVACSSSKKAVGADAPEQVDAAACANQPSYSGALTQQDGLERCTDANGFYTDCPSVMGTTQNPELIIAGGAYSATDGIEIDLYNHLGAFSSGYFPVGGIDLSTQSNFHDCFACVLVDVGLNPTTHKYSDQFIAISGTMNITAISGAATVSDPGHVAGNFSNVTFQHVLIDTSNNTSTPINDGCSVTIASASFDEPIETTQANFAPRSHQLRVKMSR
jgi:hypothetical protein